MKILTHNAYWFQGYPSRWGNEKVAEVPEVLDALVELYASLEPDVLCLQEIHREDLARMIANRLQMNHWVHTPGGLRREYGGAIICRQASSFHDLTSMEGGALHERVHIRVSTKEHLELAMVHLPSNRYAGSADAGDAARVAELERVLSETPRPEVVVGDMNCMPDSPAYRFMIKSGYVDAELSASGRDARERRVDYAWLDQHRVDRLAGLDVINGGPFCRPTPEGKSWHLSDHPPLLLHLKETPDGRDSRT